MSDHNFETAELREDEPDSDVNTHAARNIAQVRLLQAQLDSDDE